MPNLVSRIFLFILKVVFGFFALLFAVSLLFAALVIFVLSMLASVVTGRKPVPAKMFSRFQQFSRPGMWPGNPPYKGGQRTDAAQVVDVEVREIPETKKRP